jgi:hypothetical protein
MSEKLNPTRDHFLLIGLARNIAALIVTLGGAAFVMFVPWWWQGMCDLLNVSLCASAIGFIASILGRCNGAVWYIAWMLGLLVCDEINNWPGGDPELILGAGFHGMCAAPMIPIGYLINFLKQQSNKRWFQNTHA